MKELSIINKDKTPIDEKQLAKSLALAIEDVKGSLKKVLIIPPDITRLHSQAGIITAIYYEMLKDTCQIDVLPALGTHEAMSKEECLYMFKGVVPYEALIHHDWNNDVIKIGEVPREYVAEISEGLVDEKIDVEVNAKIMDDSYDLIISVGQVVPHEVVGMANYSKNILVGCGGNQMISQSHMLGAFYGMERIMGKDNSPVRKVFDYAEKNFLKKLPLMYVLTVTTCEDEDIDIHGLFIGRERKLFEDAVKLSQEKNLTFVDTPFDKVVVYLDPQEFRSTWLGNKAIYRTRMAIADDGELVVLAPGVNKLGEDEMNDKVIRKYGYVGRKKVLELVKENQDLKDNLSVAAHLIHGSSDGRFEITYAVDKLTKEEVEQANFIYADYTETIKKYDPKKLKDGFNVLENGEKIYYISNPALGLWADKSKF